MYSQIKFIRSRRDALAIYLPEMNRRSSGLIQLSLSKCYPANKILPHVLLPMFLLPTFLLPMFLLPMSRPYFGGVASLATYDALPE